MKDKYGQPLKGGDVVLFAMSTKGGIHLGRVSEAQLLKNKHKNYNRTVKIVNLECESLPRRWVKEGLVVRVEESLLAAARLIGECKIFSDQEGK